MSEKEAGVVAGASGSSSSSSSSSASTTSTSSKTSEAKAESAPPSSTSTSTSTSTCTSSTLGPLVTVQWLADSLGLTPGSTPNTHVRVIDASWFLPLAPPAVTRDARAEYAAARIPGAVFFDIDAVATELKAGGMDMPHMRPSLTVFSAALTSLGVGRDDIVVVYDASGIFNASARVWWTFMSFGAVGRVAILDGGLAAWRAAGFTLHAASEHPIRTPTPATSPFLVSDEAKAWLRDMTQMITNVTTPSDLVVDARPAVRFNKEVKEPRACKRLGHIPNAINCPFLSTIDPELKLQQFRSVSDLRTAFAASGIPADLTTPITCYCGTGVTGSTLLFGLYLVGYRHLSLYDGSWAQWGNADETAALIV